MAETFWIALLDMGKKKYGDCILCRLDNKTILIDGGHSGDQKNSAEFVSLPNQMRALLGTEPPFLLDLLVVTHAHSDHIGCLPTLVELGIIRPRWALVADPDLGFGTPPNDSTMPDSPAWRMRAALREEPNFTPDDAALGAFLADAYSQERNYRDMLDQLRAASCTVVRFGNSDDDALLADWKAEFEPIGLRIMGPTQAHLQAAASVIETFGRDTLDSLLVTMAKDLPQRDSGGSTEDITLYRALSQAMDGKDEVSPAINNQSILLSLERNGKRALLTGDMQLEKPEVDGMEAHMATLRQTLRDAGPFDFVKLPHHGSYNACGETLLTELGNPQWVTISTGTGSKSHPHPNTLKMLQKRRDDNPEFTWLRTDINGFIFADFSGDTPLFEPGRAGTQPNDISPPHDDFEGFAPPSSAGRGQPSSGTRAESQLPSGVSVPPPKPSPVVSAPPVTPVPPTTVATDAIEFSARVPHTRTRVVFTVEVFPGDAATVNSFDGERTPNCSLESSTTLKEPPLTTARLRLGNGQDLSGLLFVTHSERLRRNIGETADAAIATIRAAGREMVDLAASFNADMPFLARDAAAIMRPALTDKRGVVLLGGYDVVPAQTLDTLAADLREKIRQRGFDHASGATNADQDDFVVWNDDVYGDVEAFGSPDLPVSRIPDGHDPELVRIALGAGPVRSRDRISRSGIRNRLRDFATTVFQDIPGEGDMVVCGPFPKQELPAANYTAPYLYLMLHGSDRDGSRFWGEGDPREYIEALRADTLIPPSGGRLSPVVFTGCCWGALPVTHTAFSALRGNIPAPRRTEESVALQFLRGGTLAFIGCTGVHYSPPTPDLYAYGAPIHHEFWRFLSQGLPPAAALFAAKQKYLDDLPHGLGGIMNLAIENKIARQYTCLGLGW